MIAALQAVVKESDGASGNATTAYGRKAMTGTISGHGACTANCG